MTRRAIVAAVNCRNCHCNGFSVYSACEILLYARVLIMKAKKRQQLAKKPVATEYWSSTVTRQPMPPPAAASGQRPQAAIPEMWTRKNYTVAGMFPSDFDSVVHYTVATLKYMDTQCASITRRYGHKLHAHFVASLFVLIIINFPFCFPQWTKLPAKILAHIKYGIVYKSEIHE